MPNDLFTQGMEDFNKAYPESEEIDSSKYYRDSLMLQFLQTRALMKIQKENSHILNKLNQISDATLVTAHAIYNCDEELGVLDEIKNLADDFTNFQDELFKIIDPD